MATGRTVIATYRIVMATDQIIMATDTFKDASSGMPIDVQINNKLRSQAGASITFALLLFLVCAVICGVIIVAATAAAGRLSNLASTEQKYYAVNSAAELVKTLMDGKSASVVAAVDEDGSEGEAVYILNEAGDAIPAGSKGLDLIEDAAIKTYSINKNSTAAATNPLSLTVKDYGSGAEKSMLSANITEAIDGSTITFYVSDSESKYQKALVFDKIEVTEPVEYTIERSGGTSQTLPGMKHTYNWILAG